MPSETPHAATEAGWRVWPLKGYLLSRLPEVPGVGEPPVQLGQFLQHFHQQREAGPLLQVERPAGGQDLLRAEAALVGGAG